jgi:hypothetical protein
MQSNKKKKKSHIIIMVYKAIKQRRGWTGKGLLTRLIASTIKDGLEHTIKPRRVLKRAGDGGAVLLLNKDVRGSSHEEESK